MANKEAVAIVLDVGPEMNNGLAEDCTFLQQAINSIDMILQRKLFAESKDEVALVLFGTDGTANDLASVDNPSAYSNITVARPLGPVDWDLLKYVETELKPGNTPADFLDAVVVAMDHLYKSVQAKKGFTSKRVVLFSTVAHEFGDDQLNDIIGSLKEANIEFDVIGPNLDDSEDKGGMGNGEDANGGGIGKPKSAQQKTGEALLRHILNNDLIEGASYSFREALHTLSHFQSRQVRSTAWKCLLEIGTGLKIPVCLYTKMKEAKAKSFRNVHAKEPNAELERLRTSHLNNDEETEVEKDDLIDGYRFGSTLVPFSAEDKDALKFQTEKCFKVLGFTKSENVKRHQTVGDSTWVCVADSNDESAAVAVSAIINALYETNMVAIVRRVYAANGAVRLGCLVPNIKKNYECLYYMELPFSEDLRQFTFGSLPVEELDASSSAPNRKYAPNDDQLAVMDELIDAMDLSAADKDIDGNKIEALKPKLTFNPYLQRLYQCLQHRAMHPDQPLPELSPLVAGGLEVPSVVKTRVGPIVDQMKKKFHLEPVAKKETVTGDTIFKANEEPEETEEPAAKKAKLDDAGNIDGGIQTLLKQKVTDIGTVTPVEDFQELLQQKDEHTFESVQSKMQKTTVNLIVDSFGTQSYEKAMSCLKALRAEVIKNPDAVKSFNDFLTELKDTLGAKGRDNFWQEMVSARLSLISTEECGDAADAVSTEKAEQFLQATVEPPPKEPEQNEPADTNELLDEME